MFGIGMTEFILIAVVVLLVFGPEKIPTVARTVARFYREVRTTGKEFTDVFKNEMGDLDGDLKGFGQSIFGDDTPGSQPKQAASASSGTAKDKPPRQTTPVDWLETQEEEFGDG